jgi:agmatine deiminase
MDGFRMPAEWSPHERTLMTWPCRASLWGDLIGGAKAQTAGVANAIAAFEPVTMVARDAADAAQARAALTAAVDVVELPADDSWLRDNGPVYVVDADRRRRIALAFTFNAWGGKYEPYDKDDALAALLARRLGDEVREVPFVFEGGSVHVDGSGTLIATEQCLLHETRNPDLSRVEIVEVLRAELGVERVVWLGDGIVEDVGTDGHVDLIAAFTGPRRVLLQSVPGEDPNFSAMAENRRRLEAADIEVTGFPILPRVEIGGRTRAVSHLNFYVCNGAVIVPLAGQPRDDEAVARIGAEFPDRQAVGVPADILAAGGGGPHCITQQVPALAA